MKSLAQYHAIVVGGGPVGAAAAALLAAQSRRVALLDGRQAAMPEGRFDPRVVAVSPGSRNILEAAGGWRLIPADRICPFARMHVESGDSHVDFQAGEHGLDALGYIAELPALQAGLWQAMRQAGQVEILAPVKAVAVDFEIPELVLDDGRVLSAELLIAADGARSWLRQQAGIGVETWYYNQRAVVCHLEPERKKGGDIAWQRFTDDGPLALLPLPDGRFSLVWSVPEAKARELMALDQAAFLEQLSEASGEPFGAFASATRRFAFPLMRQRANALAAGRLALIGDAARAVHPLAGQGLNLGLMDAAALAQCLSDWQPGQDPERHLARYRRWRAGAGELMAGGIHAINEVSASRFPLAGPLRTLGLKAAGAAWPARELFVRRACGLDHDAPRLCRGAK